MKNSVPRLLMEHNRKLRRVALENYRVLLKRVCRVHRDAIPGASVALEILNRTSWDKGCTWDLMSLADSLSSQMYDDARKHFFANQFASLIRKYPFPGEVNPFSPERDAYEKYLKAEALCARTNKLFRLRRTRTGKGVQHEGFYKRARDFIAHAIGFAPDVDRILSETGFGPGANIGVTGDATSAARKIAANWTVTPGAYHYGFAAVMRHAQMREEIFRYPGGVPLTSAQADPFGGPFGSRAKCVAYNKITFVPKTARIHRPIAVEPVLNSFLQKGTDVYMRARLKRIGIDLTDQEPNTRWAREGSLDEDNGFTTIDLSSASDSVSIEIVRELLPPEWFEFLNSLRSKSYSYKGKVSKYEKFCSMGNGFCFPLESLIFASICYAAGAGQPGKDFLVYGDDIIVRKDVFHEVVAMLFYSGFRVNRDKTFSSGPFRESCGRDWFGGIDVRPYTLDFSLDTVQCVNKVLNGSMRNEFTQEFFLPIRSWLINLLPRSLRFFRPYPGPEESGIDSFGDEFLSCAHAKRIRLGGSNYSWAWKEIIPHAVADREIIDSCEEHPHRLLYGALSGSASREPFTFRRRTKTKVRLVSHPGSQSLWLPAPSFLMRR